jgi:hypothetical protein
MLQRGFTKVAVDGSCGILNIVALAMRTFVQFDVREAVSMSADAAILHVAA